jgi:hypothetical protein
MKDDCDLVLYDWCVAGSNQIVWSSKTGRKNNGKGCFLQLSNQGKLQVIDAKNNNELVWESESLNEDCCQNMAKHGYKWFFEIYFY